MCKINCKYLYDRNKPEQKTIIDTNATKLTAGNIAFFMSFANKMKSAKINAICVVKKKVKYITQ